MGINNISLMGPNPAQPFDIQTQQAMLEQQRAIANALIAQSLAEKSPVIRTAAGNQFGRDVANWGDPISNIAKAFIGGRMQNEAMGGQAQLAEETQRRYATDMADVMGKLRGTPAQEGVGPPNPDNTPAAGIPATPPDYGAAMQSAAGSTVPAVRAQALQMLKDWPSPEMALKYGDKYSTGGMKDFFQNPANVAALEEKPKVHFGEGIATPYKEGTVGKTVATETFGPPKTNALGVPVQESNVTGRQHAFPAYGDVSTVKAFENLDSAAMFEKIKKGYDEYKDGAATLGTVSQIRDDLSRLPDDKLGTLAWFRNNASKLGEMFGMEKLATVSSMEDLHAALGHLDLQKVRALAPVTKEDVSMIQSIVGSESNSKRALIQIMGVLETATLRAMSQHEAFVAAASKRAANPQAFQEQWVPPFTTTPVAPPQSSRTVNFSDLPP